VGRGKWLNKGAGRVSPQILQHPLNKIGALFENEVLVYQ